jgi:DNA-binding NtrC family response regulator
MGLGIVVVDDEHIVTESLRAFLEDFGYGPVRTFPTVDSASEDYRSRTERPALIISDNNTNSDMKGMGFLREIRDNGDTETAFCLLCTFLEPDEADYVHSQPRTEFLGKPASDEEVLGVCSKYLLAPSRSMAHV